MGLTVKNSCSDRQLLQREMAFLLPFQKTRHSAFLKIDEFSGDVMDSMVTVVQFSSVQLLSRVQLFVTLWTVARQASVSITNPGAYSKSCPLSQ